MGEAGSEGEEALARVLARRGRRAACGTPGGAARRAARSCASSSGWTRPRPTSTWATRWCSQKLRTFQDLGHTVVLIVGDYTARVGDPSGRSDIRPELSPEEIEANALTYQEQAFKVLDRERTEVRHNSEWLEMPSGQFFDLVRRFTVARLLERDDFQKRMEAQEGISTLELLYPGASGVRLGGGRGRHRDGGLRPEVQPPVRPRRADRVRPGAAVDPDHADPGGDLWRAEDVEVLRQLRRRDRRAGGHVREADERPRRRDGRVLPACCWAANSIRTPIPTRRSGRWRASWWSGSTQPRTAAAAEARFDSVHKHGEVPDDIPEVELGEGETVHLPALLGAGVRRLLERGAAPDRAGRREGRGTRPWRPTSLDVPADDLRRRVIQLGKRRFARLI